MSRRGELCVQIKLRKQLLKINYFCLTMKDTLQLSEKLFILQLMI